MAASTSHGRFTWHELITHDPKAAIAFYTRVVGWKTQAWEKNPSYTLLLTESGPVGGIMLPPPEAKAAEAPPSWLPYVETPDVKATVDAAVRLGANVYKPVTQIPDVGRFAVLADPQGAVFAVITPQTPRPVNDEPRLGEFSWHELSTSDQVAAFRFYEQLFGWEKTEAMDMGPDSVYQMFGWGGKSRGGIYNAPKDRPSPRRWLSYVLVADTREAAKVVAEAGGKVVNGPMEVPGGSLIAVGVDPEGAAFAVHSLAPVAAGRR